MTKFGVRTGAQGVVGGEMSEQGSGERMGFHVGTGRTWARGHSDLGLAGLGVGYG